MAANVVVVPQPRDLTRKALNRPPLPSRQALLWVKIKHRRMRLRCFLKEDAFGSWFWHCCILGESHVQEALMEFAIVAGWQPGFWDQGEQLGELSARGDSL